MLFRSAYLERARTLLETFVTYNNSQVPRTKNTHADALAHLASTKDAQLLDVIPVEYFEKPSITAIDLVAVTSERVSWMSPIYSFLKNGSSPDDKKVLRLKSGRYVIYDDKLYRRGFSLPLQKCIDEEDANYILREVHEGICSNHASGYFLAQKIIRQGYYWPTLKQNAWEFAKKCDKCQRFAPIPRSHPEKLTAMTSLWPFAVWGIDLIGQMPMGRGRAQYAVVTVDYFMKWMEAEALATITVRKICDFLYRSVICRYSIPQKIVSDNGT